MQDQENEITDEVTPLEVIITGGVILSFGLLYWLFNGGFGSNVQANVPTAPPLTYASASQSQYVSSGLNIAPSKLSVVTAGEDNEAVATKPSALMGQIEATSPPTDQAVLDAIAIVEAQTKRQAAEATKQAETLRVASERAVGEQAKLVSINTAEMVKQQSTLDKLNARIVALENANTSLQAELAEVNKPVIEEPEEPVNEPIPSMNNPTPTRAQDMPISFIERFADAIAQKRTNEAIIFDDVMFDSGSSRLAPKSREQMRLVADLLKENPTVKILIRGHTDNIGSVESNTVLSITRSTSVRNELIEQGIDASRLAIEGVGLFEPIATNNTEEGRRKNRRIELTIVE